MPCPPPVTSTGDSPNPAFPRLRDALEYLPGWKVQTAFGRAGVGRAQSRYPHVSDVDRLGAAFVQMSLDMLGKELAAGVFS